MGAQIALPNLSLINFCMNKFYHGGKTSKMEEEGPNALEMAQEKEKTP